MTSKSYCFVAYFLLKTNDHCYRNNHNRQPKCDGNSCNTNGRTRNIFLALLKMNAFSYEVF